MNEWSDIGEQLQEARVKRELSLQDVAHETRIPLVTLRSLEENDYSSFSSLAYTKSFLQQYSEFLKIDAHEVLENFNTGNILVQSDDIEYLDQEKSASTQRTAPIRRSSASSDSAPPSLAQPLLILLITGGLIVGGIWGFLAVEKRLNADPDPVAQTPPDQVAPTATPNAGTPTENLTPPPRTADRNRPPRAISSIGPNGTVDEPPEAPVYVFPEDSPPPRAIIVNEDEE